MPAGSIPAAAIANNSSNRATSGKDKKMKIAITEAEGRATARTITAAKIATILGNINVPKNRLNGTKVFYDGGEKLPSAYKWMPESTHFVAENISGKWYVTEIARAKCPNRQTRGRIEYSDAAKAWILENASTII